MKGSISLTLKTVITLGYCFFLLSGCIGSSTPLHEYTLTPLVQQNESAQRSWQQTLMIMPVLAPSWNVGSGIVTRSSSNAINTSPTHLWAGSLQDQLTATLAENIRRLGSIKNVQVYPGSRFAKPDLLLEVNFLRFDGEFSNGFTCSAIWILSDNHRKKTLHRRQFSTTVPVDSDGYTGYVTAASTAISQLSKDISSSLEKILEAP